MTGAMASRFERRNHGKGHSYYLDGAKVPGVTGILDMALRKRALENWAGDATAEAAVNRWDEYALLPIADRLAALKRARWEARDAAALHGTIVHGYAERLRHGEPVEVAEEHLGAVQAVARFMDHYGLEPVMAERPVFNATHRWAGTFDLLAGIGGTLWLLDWKTGKGVYPETALQLAAYAHAEWVLPTDDGEPAPWTPPERVGAVHITADSAELHEVDAGDAAYLTFRYAAMVASWAEKVSEAWRDKRAWPIGAALALEEVTS